MASTLDILKRLNSLHVEYVVVGGLAGVVHGSGVVTEDVDVCAPLDQENLTRIVAALRDLHPRFRMTPARLPLSEEVSKLAGFRDLYLLTDLGQIDFLSEITGLGNYAEVQTHTVAVDLGGTPCRVLDLEALILSKRALGRPKDLRVAAELEAIREQIRRSKRT